ncbi:3-methyl-2-oxobutanoate hydroxymethyltransferase 1 mitochondrial [Zea mays]|uniref:3-methyl-2-oxobutanoate hydroxymethyltransferase 1 mitochondrial n=1 Tax=Zea mays TaxID=4577 RepID=A0A1D6L6B0_MAIZE|nr:3-methyl-2-oxobutanoate hydroxymethyltransferase 1 mitochondrial [Zea mays]
MQALPEIAQKITRLENEDTLLDSSGETRSRHIQPRWKQVLLAVMGPEQHQRPVDGIAARSRRRCPIGGGPKSTCNRWMGSPHRPSPLLPHLWSTSWPGMPPMATNQLTLSFHGEFHSR